MLATVCEELGLPHLLRLLYRNLCDEEVNLIARSKLTLRGWMYAKGGQCEFLMDTLFS
jgi:hypothetical protein